MSEYKTLITKPEDLEVDLEDQDNSAICKRMRYRVCH